MRENKIILAHGSGGASTGELIKEVFAEEFQNSILDEMEDAALLPIEAELVTEKCFAGDENETSKNKGRLVMTTDSFVVDPVEFSGGDLGRLAVCGTVNDLLMRGAKPLYLTSSWILEEGADIEVLKRLVHSMAVTAKEAGVQIVCGDTKVINGNGGIYANTAGVGIVHKNDGKEFISASGAEPGDVVIVSGNMGDHHAAILSERMSIETDIKSDVAPLTEMVSNLSGLDIHCLRDITRGGLATVCKELAIASGVSMELEMEVVPVEKKVKDFAGLLGLDPLYMGNEGKLICIVSEDDSQAALERIKTSNYGENAAIIGRITEKNDGSVFVKTAIGGKRSLDVLRGEGLPRIC
ncbi:MAG: hydrogenase expression/formation protein HypE [Eubacterium sp.]|nr:hydrogenase expression/formation protein HypE [Eubacterium sp.]